MLSAPVIFLACSQAPPVLPFADAPRPHPATVEARLAPESDVSPFHALLTSPSPPPTWHRSLEERTAEVPSLAELARQAPCRRGRLQLSIHVDGCCVPR